MDAVVSGLFVLGLAASLIFYVRQRQAGNRRYKPRVGAQTTSSTPPSWSSRSMSSSSGPSHPMTRPQTNASVGPHVRTTSPGPSPTSGSSARRSSPRPKGKAIPNYGRVPKGPRYTATSSGCWEWNGDRNPAGYGVVLGKLAHRVEYERAKGPIKPGLVLLHECDNPPCVNPAHLRPGTRAENTADMYAKKRARPFGRNQTLTPAERDDVAERYLAGQDAADLAQEFGVSRSYVTTLGSKRARETDRTRQTASGRRGGKRLTDAQRAEIARRYRDGTAASELMEEFGVSRGYVSLLFNRTYPQGGREPQYRTGSSFDVEEIVKLRRQGKTHQEIADIVGMSKSHVGRLLMDSGEK